MWEIYTGITGIYGEYMWGKIVQVLGKYSGR